MLPAPPQQEVTAGIETLRCLARDWLGCQVGRSESTGVHASAAAAAVEQPLRQLWAAVRAWTEQDEWPAAETIAHLRRDVLPPARQLAVALLEWQQQPEQQAAARLEMAQAAAQRSCAYVRCPNLAGEGGPLAGQGVGAGGGAGERESASLVNECGNGIPLFFGARLQASMTPPFNLCFHIYISQSKL